MNRRLLIIIAIIGLTICNKNPVDSIDPAKTYFIGTWLETDADSTHGTNSSYNIWNFTANQGKIFKYRSGIYPNGIRDSSNDITIESWTFDELEEILWCKAIKNYTYWIRLGVVNKTDSTFIDNTAGYPNRNKFSRIIEGKK